MKVIITGGGTGGHIYPGIAIANQLKKQNPSHQVLFIGARGKMEMQVVPAAGYSIVGLPIRSIERKGLRLLKNLFLPFQLLASLWQAQRVLKNFQPDVVVGTGGYASFPTVYAAACRQIPILLQEQNAYPGIANRLLARYANKICVAYTHMALYFPASKLVVTGNPVRQSLTQLPDRAEACSHLGCTPKQPIVLVIGGSLGAAAITESILEAIPIFISHGLQIILSTGKAYFSKIENKIPHIPQVKIVPYLTRMDWALAAADLVVSRGGAMSIAEISLAQKPAIFIPSPHVAADHQTKNVLPLVEQGAAMLIQETEVATKLVPTIVALAQDSNHQQRLVQNLQRYGKPQAAADIVTLVEKLKPASNGTKR